MKKIINRLLPYIKEYKKNVILNVIFNILNAFFGTLSFISLIPMMTVLFDKTKVVDKKPIWSGEIFDLVNYGEAFLNFNLSNLLDQGKPKIALLIVVTLVISTFLFKNLFGYLAAQNMMYLRNGVLTKLRTVLYDNIISLPISFYSQKRKGDVMARMLGDIGEMQNSLFIILELIVREPLTILFSIYFMLTMSWQLTIFVFLFLPIAGFIISKIGKNLKSRSLQAQQEGGHLISIVEETLSGLKVIKGYNAEPNFLSKFSDSVNRLLNLNNKIGNKNNLAGPVSETLGIITIAILLWYGGNLVLVEKAIEGPQFLAYMGLAYNILTPAKAISKASYRVKNGIAAAERVFEIMDQDTNIPDTPDAKNMNTFEKNIEIKNISFKYEDDYVLKNFSLTVPIGKTVALVGQSGSGKSTIANLLTRFYDVNEGDIFVDGHHIKKTTKKSLRALMGLVTQDSILFNDTIKYNIQIGNKNATDYEIIAALKVANAWEFVKDLPNGINTNIGDAGGKLSGGQKQRLSIARAVLKNPPIMVLDEATSALDTESEKLVQVALENMMKNRTSVVIAHRLSTIQNADLIVVMKKGEIIEQGNHQELIAKNGMYKRLVEMQSIA